MVDDARTVQERRRELLRRRVAESGLAAKQTVAMPRVRAGERYPLSAGQRRMWFLQTMDPADAALNICVAYRLTGDVDQARLRAAFGAFVERHAVLRTTYGVDSAGEPYQIYSDDAEINWKTTDLTESPELERNRRIESLAREEFGKPVKLTSEIPLRVTLIRTGAAEFVLLLVVHHIAWDEECWEVFFGELSAAYNGQDLSAAAPQFVAVEVMESAVEPSISDVGYWADRLRPPPEPLELPGARAAHPSRRSERRTHSLPAELYRRVEDFARLSSASPLMVLLAAFGVLVRRYTGATDFLVSVPVTERSATSAAAIGYFGNTLLLRITTRPHDTFTSFVAAVRETCLEGFAHQSVGIDRVIREINPERMGHDGMDQLVRLGFSMRKSTNGFALDGITVRQLRLGAVTADLPLALAIVLEPEGVFVEFDYQIDVLSGELADQMRTHYLQLLDSALADPEHRLVNLDMLGAGERKSVLAQSHGELAAAAPTTMVALLEAAATGAPDAVALVSDATELTYAGLHGRANRLARWLIEQGFGADDIIGLRISTSVEFIVAMLAVLKAGAAYLPIDPAYPGDRIEYLVTDAQPKAVIGHDELDAAEQSAAQLSDTALTDADRLSPLHPEQLAYVIYTSGSTGQPKGVAVSHRAIAEHIEGFVAEWSMTADDRLLQSSSVSFDASLLDIFVTLSLGAQLIVPKPDAFSDIPYVADLIGRRGVTVLHMVPSMLSTLLMLPQVNEWRQLRHVPVGGEALPGEIADKFSGYFDAKLRNHYGPTEAVVCSTHMPVTGSHGARVVPIGVPNRNVYAYVLDEELQPVPAEVIGELYLGGAQLARGYLGRPSLTAQRFVADPFGPGMRLYRTGDLVRRNVSGELEFVGRADEQVKIRGYRIEPGEIESVIAMHPAVVHCLVVPEDTAAGPILAAYVVPVTSAETAFTELELDEIRGHAASVLPEYMVPGAYAVIPEIPLTVSGKLDKRALPAPTRISARQYREPVTATEQRMCAIFARLFGREKVGAEDSFFGLGGHSLLAARLIAQIRAEFGMALDVRAVFDAPTPAGLAAVLVEQVRAEFDIDLDEDLDELEIEQPVDDGGAADAPVLPSTRPDQVKTVRSQRPPLSYSQLAMWFQHQMRGTSVFFNLALSLRFTGPLDTTALALALNDVVARHEALRTTFPEHEGLPYQRVQPDLVVDLAVCRVAAGQVDETVAELRRYAFALDSEPLIRPTLLMVDPENHLLLLLIHHIVTDHTSLGVIFEDLLSAYRARAAGQAPGWDALPLQFIDHAVWQQNAFDGPWGQAELAHWRDVLAGLPDEISIGADYSRPPILGSRPQTASFVVPAERRAALAQLAEQSGASEFMVYQAALAVVLHKLGGGSDIAIGSPVAARVEAATAHVNGPFANVVVLRNDLSEDPSLRTTVVRCRSTVLDALAHQEFPIDRLVESLNPRRSTSRNHPLFQSSIHLRGARDWARRPRRLTETGQTTVVPVPMEFEISLLDLELSMDVLPDGDLEARLVANADLYSRETVALIADALESAFDAYALTPDLRISALQLLPAAAMERLLAPAIPAPRQRPLAAGAGSAATERALIALLEELLDITDVDREDNFFALGGDSIISVQWAARAGAQGLALTPVMVFEHLTIAELAAAVDAAADHPVAEGDPVSVQQAEPMSASGLDADALAALSAAWHSQS